MGNRVENYLTDLAYALDYAYNATSQNTASTVVALNQNSRVSPLSGNTVSIGGHLGTTTSGNYPAVTGESHVIGCNGSITHETDLISYILKLRNPANLAASACCTVTADSMVCGRSAYDVNGNLISGNISPRSATTDIQFVANGNTTTGLNKNEAPTGRYPKYKIPKGYYSSKVCLGFNLTNFNASPSRYHTDTNEEPTGKTPYIGFSKGYYSQQKDYHVKLTTFGTQTEITNNGYTYTITKPKGYHSLPIVLPVTPEIKSRKFTYIIDSSAALTRWAQNTGGYDYTSVLIKKGEWSWNGSGSNGAFNLTNTKTVAVVGEPGSLLKIYLTGAAATVFRYSSLPGMECYMENVNIEIDPQAGYGNTVFYKCVNLHGCTCKVVQSVNTPTLFSNCVNMVNCRGIAGGLNNGSKCFFKCNHLIGCYGSAISSNDGNIQKTFKDCHDLVNCNGERFEDCERLVNCKAEAHGTGAVWTFYDCKYLFNCIGKSEYTGSSGGGTHTFGGFHGCTYMENCKGEASTSVSDDASGYGFQECSFMKYCRPSGRCKTSVFSSCYSGSSTAAGETAAGGWNSEFQD